MHAHSSIYKEGVTKKEGTQKTTGPLFTLAGAGRTTLQVDRKAHTQNNHIADPHSELLSTVFAEL
jgi:hypothetical protein